MKHKNKQKFTSAILKGLFTIVLILAPATVLAAAPTITSVTPNHGTYMGGTSVVIIGTGFASPISVTFGGISATNIVFVSATEITATTPACSGSCTTNLVDLTVDNILDEDPSATLTSAFQYIAPGGTFGNLNLWLKADVGVSNTGDGSSATAWTSAEGNGYFLDRTTSGIGGSDPTWNNNEVNGYPVVSFDDTDDRLGISGFYGMPSTDFYTTVVTRRDNFTSGVDESIWTYGANDSRFAIHSDGFVLKRFASYNPPNAAGYGSDDGTPHIHTARRTGSTYTEAYDGYVGSSGAADFDYSPVQGQCFVLGEYMETDCTPYSSTYDYEGDLAEMIVYSSYPSDTDQQKINSYLAIKYGITLDQSAIMGGTAYLDSTGNTIWTADRFDVYEYDIAGLGRDDASGLYQTGGKSQSVDAIFRTFGTTPENDLEFITWANDDGTATWTSTDAPDKMVLLDRKWIMEIDGTFGEGNFEFDVENSNFNVPNLLSGTTYYIVYDNNGDGYLNDETPYPLNDSGTSGDETASDNKWTLQIPSVDGTGQRSIFTLASDAKGPGGVASNLEVWLKADTGVTNTGGPADDGEDAEAWTDQSFNSLVFDHNTSPAIGGTYPAWYANRFNNNPALSFDGSTDRLGRSSFSTWPQTEHFITMVYRRNNNTATEWMWNYGVTADDDQSFFSIESDGSFNNQFAANPYPGSTPTPAGDDNQPHIITSARTGTTISQIFDGKSLGSEANTGTGTQGGCFVFAEEADGLCAGFSPAQHFYGDIAEYIIYNNYPSATDQQKINSYLAIKYGVSLDQSGATSNDGVGDYLDSQGNSIWDANNESGQNPYRYHIAGIGQDDTSELNQTSSKSQNSEAILQISEPSEQANEDFLIFGHNNGNRVWTATDAPSIANGADVDYQILERQWASQETNEIGTVDLEFDVRDPQWMVPALLSGNTFYFVYDKDGNGNLNNECPDAGTCLNPGGVIPMVDDGLGDVDTTANDNKWTVRLDMPAYDLQTVKFTLATPTGDRNYPAGVDSNLKLWLRPDTDSVTTASGDGSTISAWEDLGPYQYIFNNTLGGSLPIWYSSLINGQPALTFPGTNDRLGLREFNDFPTGNFWMTTVYQSPTTARGAFWSYDGTGTYPRVSPQLDSEAFRFYFSPSGTYYTSTAANASDNNPHIFTSRRTGTTLTTLLDGKQLYSNTSISFAPLTDKCFVLGEWMSDTNCTTFNPTYDYNQTLGEIIIYSDYPSITDQQKINSYLALKYGITLDQTTPTDYLASNGTTLMWNSTTEGTYNNDIAGIGRDDTTQLNHTQSKSANPDSIITVSNPTGQDNLEFLTWANDNGSIGTISTELPTGLLPNVNSRLSREWFLQEQGGDIGGYTIDFNLGTQSALKKNGSASDYALLIDWDGDFSNAVYTTGATKNGDHIYFTDVDFSDILMDGPPFYAYVTLAGPSADGPGNVTESLALWLKADAGTGATNQNDPITTWADQSVSGNNATHTSDPTLELTNGLNGYPAIYYDGGDDGHDQPNSVTNEYSMFGVAQMKGTTNGRVFSSKTGNALFGFHSGYEDRLYLDGNPNIVPTTSPVTTNPILYSLDRATSGAYEMYKNGKILYSGAGSANTIWRLGIANGGTYTGEDSAVYVSEVVQYNKSLSAAEKQKIHSYLSFKYGMTLSDDTNNNSTPREAIGAHQEGDYVASDGTTYMFDISANGTYVNDIAGIGRDDKSQLLQESSQSINSDSLLSISNADNLDNLEFMSWGNDDGSILSSSSDIPSSGMPANAVTRITRAWQVQENGGDGVGSVTVSFDLNAQSAISDEATINDYALLIDTDGTFSSGATIIQDPAYTVSITSNIISFEGLTIPDGSYISLAGPVAPMPGGFSSGIELWLKANNGPSTTTDDATVSTWLDRSGNFNHGTGVNTPAYQSDAANLINYNPVVELITNDYYTMTNTSLAMDTSMMFVVASPNSNSTYRTLYKGGAEDAPLVINTGTNNVGYWDSDGGGFKDSNLDWLPGEVALFRAYIGADSAPSIFSKNSGSGFSTPNIEVTGAEYDYFGSSNLGSESFGDVAETIIYNYGDGLTDGPVKRIESYLALKYGLTLDQTSENDYFASDCGVSATCDSGTIMWDASLAGDYKYDIAGIGTDVISGLNQTQSKSSNTDAILRVSNTNNQEDLEFLVWGNNNGTPTWSTTDAPTGFSISTRRWQVQEVGDFGTVDLEFNVEDADFNIPNTSDNNYYFVYDADNDGTLADETPTLMSNVEDLWSINSLNFDGSVGTADGTIDFAIAGYTPTTDTASLTGSDTFDDLEVSYTTTPGGSRGVVNWKKDGSSIALLNMPFEGNGGNESTGVLDYSDSYNHGTVTGATWSSTGGYNGGGGYSFAGGNYYIESNNNVGLANGASPVTMCVWVKPNIVSGTYWLAQMGHATASNSSFSLFQSNGKLVFDTWNNQLATSANVLTANTWTHFCAVYESGNFSTADLYVNGVEKASSFIYGTGGAAPTYVDGTVRLGSRKDDNISYIYSGSLDEFLVFDYALSPEQIQTIYEAGETFDTIASDETTTDETWEACVTVNASGLDGTTKCTGETTITATSETPAGIHDALELWFKADAGVTNTGNSTDAIAWTDQSGTPVTLDKNTSPAIGGTYPTFYNNRINFNPALSFDGGTDILGMDSLASSPETDLTMAIVYNDFAPSGVGENLFSYATTANANEILTTPRESGAVSAYLRGTESTSSAVGAADGNPHIHGIKRSGSSVTQTLDNLQVYSGTNSSILLTSGCLVFGADQDSVCGGFVAGEYYDGDIAEVIVYADDLTTTQQQQINSYLALKYGITLDQTTPTDYIASDMTEMWNKDATGASTHNNDIAGIGRDDAQGLNQTQSRSSESDSLLIISEPSDLDDYEFMSWGNDNAISYSTEIPSGGMPSNAEIRLSRVWQVQNDDGDGVGTVNVSFDLGNTGAIRNTGTPGDYALLIDGTIVDGDFSDAAIIDDQSYTVTFNEDVISFQGVTIVDGSYITLAGPLPSRPGGIGTNLELWFKADNGVTNTGNATNATAWMDQGNYGITVDHSNSSIASGATFPTYYSSLINGNPGLTFDNTSDRLGVSSLTRIPANDLFISAVYRRNDYPSSNENVFSYATGSTPSDNEILFEPRPNGTLYSFIHNAGVVSANISVDNGIPHIATMRRTGTTLTNVFDGLEVATGTNANTIASGGCLVFGEDQDSLCGGFDPLNAWEGDIAEEIVYSGYPTESQQQQINSYLAIKYGITLDQTTPQNYLNSLGNPIWTADATYKYDIAGIGQDDDSGLDQIKSRSVNPDSVLIVSTAEHQDDLDFLTWSNNNGTATWSDINAPTEYKLLDRKWNFQETNDLGTVTLELDPNNANFDIPDPETGFTYYLAIDKDDDGFLITETLGNGIYAMTPLDSSTWAINIDPIMATRSGLLFTIATKSTPATTVDNVIITGEDETDDLALSYNLTPISAKAIVDWTVNESSIAVLNMPFEGNGGSEATDTTDYSTYNNPGTIHGPTWSSTGGPDGSGSYDFVNTSDQYIDTGSNFASLTDNFSVSFWIKPAATQESYADIFGNHADNKTGVVMQQTTTTNQFGWGYGNGTSFNQGSGLVQLTANTWQHLVAVKTSNDCLLYLNGVEVGSTPGTCTSSVVPGSRNWWIGQGYLNNQTIRYFNGGIDNFQIFERSLTEDQIIDLYNSSTPSYDNIDHGITNAGEIWQACVTPNIGTDGTQVCSNTTQIKPTVDTATLPAAASHEDLEVNYSTTPSLALGIVNWIKNQSSIAVLNMPFEANNGVESTDTYDYSDSANDGTVTGATWLSSGGVSGDGAYDFNGSSDYITIADDNSLDLTNEITLETWVNLDTIGHNQGLIYKGSHENEYGPWSLAYVMTNSPDGIYFVLGNEELVLITQDLTTDTWYHVVATYDGQTAKIYLNGNLEDTDAFGSPTSLATDANSIQLGRYYGTTTNRYLDGTQDGVQIYDRALSAEQIALLYNSGSPRNNIPPTVLDMAFEANGGSEATSTLDSSESGNDGTVTNATWSATAGVDGTGAYSYDGNSDYITFGQTGLPSGAEPRTMMTWFKTSNSPSYVFLGGYGSSDRFTFVHSGTGAGVDFNGYGKYVEFTPDGQWHHLAAVFPEGGTNIFDTLVYLDGALPTPSTAGGDHAINTALTAGAWGGMPSAPTTYSYTGQLDDARIYDRALSAREIAAIYQNPSLPVSAYTSIASAETLSGEDWQSCITPNAGGLDGTEVCSNEITITPGVNHDNISIAGGSGTDGAYIVGDTVTVTWNNSATGDNNPDITGVTADLFGWGGSDTATMTDTTACGGTAADDIYEACHTLVSGSIDDTNVNVTVTATSPNGSTGPVADTTDAVVDNIPPTVSASAISVTGASGGSGEFIAGDSATGHWDNSDDVEDADSSDYNSDTISSVTFNLHDWISTAIAVAGSNSSDIWTTTAQSPLDIQVLSPANVIVTATDNAGNITITSGTNDYSIQALTAVENVIITGEDELDLTFDITPIDAKGIVNWLVNESPITVLNMPFEANGGSESTSTKDFSTYENNGTVTNATWNSTGGIDGKGAYDFNGSTDYINIGSDASLEGMSQLSMEAWVSPDDVSLGTNNEGHVIIRNDDTYKLYFIRSDTNNWNGLVCLISGITTTGANTPHYAMSNFTAGQWYHTACTYDGSTVRLYVNGTEVDSENGLSGNVPTTTKNTRIGVGSDESTYYYYFDGDIDEVKIYDSALTAGQITSTYNNYPVSGTPNYQTISAEETNAGEIWQACVTPNNGTSDGTQECSNYVTIKPTVDTIDLPEANANEVLGILFTTTPIDARGIIDWKKNQSSIAALNMPFEANNGLESTNTLDYSDNANNGTVNGATWNGTGGIDSNGTYQFNGSGNYISVADSPSLDITDEITLSAWIKPNTPGGCTSGGTCYPKIIGKSKSTDTQPYAMYGLTFVNATADPNYKKVIFGIGSDGLTRETLSTLTVPSDSWTHVAGSYDGQVVKLYINGALDTSINYTGSIMTNDNPLRIGHYQGGNAYFNGLIDEAQVLNRALSAEQIAALYNDGKFAQPDTYIRPFMTIATQETTAGDDWQACVTPNAGGLDGTEVCSNEITITAINPSITEIIPEFATTLDSALSVTINGSDFEDTPDVYLTKFLEPNIPCNNIQFISANQITCELDLTEAAVGNWSVVLVNPSTLEDTLTDGFEVKLPAPTIFDIDPNTGISAGGTPITITGTNFVDGATVEIDSIPATSVVVVNSTEITAVTPAGSVGVKTLTVTNPDEQFVNGTFEYTSSETDLTLSTFTIVPNEIVNNGVDAATLTITIRNSNGDVLPNKTVSITHTGNDTDIDYLPLADNHPTTPYEWTTNAQGQISLVLTSNNRAIYTFTATDVDSSNDLTTKPVLTVKCSTVSPNDQCVEINITEGSGVLTLTAPDSFTFPSKSSSATAQNSFTYNANGYTHNVNDILKVTDTRNSGGFILQVHPSTTFRVDPADCAQEPGKCFDLSNFYLATTESDSIPGSTKQDGIEYNLAVGPQCGINAAPHDVTGSNLENPNTFTNTTPSSALGTGKTINDVNTLDIMDCTLSAQDGRWGDLAQTVNYYLNIVAFQSPGLYEVILTFDLTDSTI